MGKKFNYHGIELDIIDDADVRRVQRENGGVITHACVRVADAFEEAWPALKARRQVRECAGCAHRIWYDPMSIPNGLIAVSLCLQCIVLRGKGL